MRAQERARRLLPGLWAGFLLCVGLVAAPAPFATLATGDAGRVVGRVFAHEAYASLALGVAVLVLERLLARRDSFAGQGSQFSTGMMLALGTVFCTVVGYFALQTMMPAARAGQGPLTFGQLHLLSVVFFAVKSGLVLTLAWRATSTVSRTASS